VNLPGGLFLFSAAKGHHLRLITHLKHWMKDTASKSIFDQKYRVVAVQGDRLLVRGILSGEVLTIINPEPDTFLSQEDYPPGKLIALTDPSTVLPN
jgi:hypothetical protein